MNSLFHEDSPPSLNLVKVDYVPLTPYSYPLLDFWPLTIFGKGSTINPDTSGGKYTHTHVKPFI